METGSNTFKNREMNKADFNIENTGPVSEKFIAKNIRTFQEAILFVKELPYQRNENKKDLLTVFNDNCGTCSTKHALLKLLAGENNFKNLELILGIFKMNAENTPAVKNTLAKYNLEYIPEAHNYLRYKGERMDFTKVEWKFLEYVQDIMEETVILPEQIADYKVAYHKQFLEKWLQENSQVPYGLDEIWRIREQCIKDLSLSI